jgi:predicted nucleotidyltransferase
MKKPDVLFEVVYGSRLYGTDTAKSDTDLKSVYLPSINDLLLGKKLSIFKTRVDSDGQPVPDKQPMPDNGVENEFFPLQTFVRDFVAGQTYALEMVHFITQGPRPEDTESQFVFDTLQELVQKFGNAEVYSMVGFAAKQTLDYVHRGARLNEAKAVLVEIKIVQKLFAVQYNPKFETRLDSSTNDGTLVLDMISTRTGLKQGTVTNNGKTLRTLEMNGRSYSETTSLQHLEEQVQKLIDKYGERSAQAGEAAVDYKSLSHAVRVYQQAIELLDTGKITFPRSNAAELLKIKSGQADLEEVKELLKNLDEEVLQKIENSEVRRKTPELVQESEKWLLEVLRKLYTI